jgi:hypothetical protein
MEHFLEFDLIIAPGLYVVLIAEIFKYFFVSELTCTSDPVLAHILEVVLLITQVHNDLYNRCVVGAALGGWTRDTQLLHENQLFHMNICTMSICL